MALLTTGAAALVTFASPVSAAWQALASLPGFGSGTDLADAVINGTQLAIYVVDASSGQFAYPGGFAYGYDDTIISVATSGTVLTVNPTGGAPVKWIKLGSNVWTYGSSGVLETYSLADATSLKSFLP